jgi:hypothetical protein
MRQGEHGARVHLYTEPPECVVSRVGSPEGRDIHAAAHHLECFLPLLIEFIKARGRALDREQVSNGFLTHPPAISIPGNKAATGGLRIEACQINLHEFVDAGLAHFGDHLSTIGASRSMGRGRCREMVQLGYRNADRGRYRIGI